jgi:hypothetical protein
MKKIISFLFVLISLAFISCAWWPGFEDRGTFNRERQLWLEQDIQNYSFKAGIDTPCEPYPRTTVFVQDGCVKYFWDNPANIHTPVDSGQPVYLLSYPIRISITDIYAEIEKCADDGRVEVQYNSILHYPTYMKCRTSYSDYFAIHISDFIIEPEMPGV